MLDVTRGRRFVYATLAGAALSFGVGAEEVKQVAEAGSFEVPYTFASGGSFEGSAGEQQFCQPGASWMRVHFNELVLEGKDTFSIQGEKAADSYVFSGKAYQGMQFFTRSFAGECITLNPQLAAKGSRFEIDRIQVGTVPTSLAPMVVAAVGDICGSDCNLTSPLITNLNPNLLLALGDLAYEDGALTEFNTVYAPYYGPFKSFTRPSPGNHEYQTPNAEGYFDYFNGVGVFTGPAGDRDKGYYTFDLGDWRIISLNSNISMTATSPQVTWLKQQLQANPKPCTLAYWHHPRFTRGNYNDHTSVQVLYQTLQDNKADIILAGHDHSYQRYKKMTANGTIDATNGIRSWVVGTGGRGFYAISADSRRDAGQANIYGILRLNLDAGSYSWSFVPEAGKTYNDTGSDTCKPKGTGGNTAPTVTITAPANGTSVASGTAVTFTGTATDTQDGTLSANLAWTSSLSGAIGTGASFSTSSLAVGTHTITAAVTDSGGLAGSATVTLTVTSTSNALTNGVPVTGISGALQSNTFYTMAVPAGATNLSFNTSGGTPDMDLYVRFGSQPTTTTSDCASTNGTNTETCSFATPSAGTYHVLLYGYSAYSGVTLTGTYTAPGGPVTVTLYSVGAQDGRLFESTETSNVGGTGNSTDNTTASLRVGDFSDDTQYKTLVSFDTSSIPDTATITAATLRIKRGTISGTSPFTTHGTCTVDMSTAFGGSTAFAGADFQAAAAASNVATMSSPGSNGTFSTGALNATGLSNISKTGTTQFRVYFTLDDNDDLGSDYIGFYSGEAASGNKPELVITYTP